jgi:AcrR family transcriptional regulator
MPASEVIPSSATRLERRRTQNRDALVRAARKLFAENGLEATTIAAIAEAADLGFGTFYRYFPDKDTILKVVLDAGRGELDDVFADPLLSTLPAPEALTRLSAQFVRAVRRNHDVLSIMWRVAMREEGAAERRLREPAAHTLPAMLVEALLSIVRRGAASGQFAAGDPAVAAGLLTSMHFYALGPTAMEADEGRMIEMLCEMELRALGAGADRGTM